MIQTAPLPAKTLQAAIVSNREYLEALRSHNGGGDTPAMALLSAVLDEIEGSERAFAERQKRQDISIVLGLLIFVLVVLLRASGRL